MFPIRDKKTPKKGSVRQLSKVKSSISVRTPHERPFEFLQIATLALLRRKYIERQIRSQHCDKIRRLLQSKLLLKQARYK